MSNTFSDKSYWEKYYLNKLKQNEILGPSPFAKFLIDSGTIKSEMNLIELGCGNGRDSLFFSQNGVHVTAVDQCSFYPQILKRDHNLNSFTADFTNLSNIKFKQKFDIIYSRFTLHSIDEKAESRTLSWIYKNLKENGIFCAEVRSTKDELYGKGIHKGGNVWFYNDHHRRFVDSDEFKSKLYKCGFNLMSYDENTGFAKFKEKDPVIIRLQASIRRKA